MDQFIAAQEILPSRIWWRVSVIKNKLVYLGRVRAPDKAAAAVEANKEFTTLSDHEQARLVIERG